MDNPSITLGIFHNGKNHARRRFVSKITRTVNTLLILVSIHLEKWEWYCEYHSHFSRWMDILASWKIVPPKQFHSFFCRVLDATLNEEINKEVLIASCFFRVAQKRNYTFRESFLLLVCHERCATSEANLCAWNNTIWVYPPLVLKALVAWM